MARMNPKVMELIKALEEALPEGEVVLVGSAKSEGLTEANKEWLASLIGVKSTATDNARTIDLLDEMQEEIEDVITKHRVALMNDDEDDEDEDICDECRLGECCGYCACCDDDEEDEDIEDEEDEEDEDTCDDCPLRAECYPYDDEEYENAVYARGYADAMTEVQKTADEAYDFGKEDAEAELDEETMALVKLIKLMREMFGN